MFSLNSDVMLYLNAKRLPETLQRLLNLMVRASFRGKADFLIDRFYDWRRCPLSIVKVLRPSFSPLFPTKERTRSPTVTLSSLMNFCSSRRTSLMNLRTLPALICSITFSGLPCARASFSLHARPPGSSPLELVCTDEGELSDATCRAISLTGYGTPHFWRGSRSRKGSPQAHQYVRHRGYRHR